MQNLGFKFMKYQERIQYIDGYEQEDIILYRKNYLNKHKALEATHKPPPTCADGIPSWNFGNKTKQRRLVFIYHNETVFKANDAQSIGWHDTQRSRTTRPKEEGKGIK